MAITDEELAIAKDIAKDKKRPVFFYWNDGVPCCPICHESLTQADKCQSCNAELIHDESLDHYCELLHG